MPVVSYDGSFYFLAVKKEEYGKRDLFFIAFVIGVLMGARMDNVLIVAPAAFSIFFFAKKKYFHNKIGRRRDSWRISFLDVGDFFRGLLWVSFSEYGVYQAGNRTSFHQLSFQRDILYDHRAF